MKPITAAFFVLALLGEPALAAGDCTCRAKGVVASEGQVACLTTAKGRRLARCQKVLNNTSWEITEESCGDLFTSPGNPKQDAEDKKKPA